MATTTADNGRVFAGRADLTERLGPRVSLVRPFRSWERALNENTNGLVRQFLPKGLDLREVRGQDVRRVERLLNTRPQKPFGYRTPCEVVSEMWPP